MYDIVVIGCYYLHEGGYVIVVVCLSLLAIFSQSLPNGFAWNFEGSLPMGQ